MSHQTSHQMIVPSNNGGKSEDYGDGSRISKFPTGKDLFGQPHASVRPEAHSSTSAIRRIAPPQVGPLVPRSERPYLSKANGRVNFYRVQPRGKSPYFAITVDEHEIGPLMIILEIYDDRGWIHVLMDSQEVAIPDALSWFVLLKERRLGYDVSIPEHYAFFDIDATPEAMSRIMGAKYPNPSVSKLPTVQTKPLRTYLIIKSTG